MSENTKETKEFMEIGGSPVPGITLRQVLRGYAGTINHISWSPDGRFLASPSEDTTIRIWDMRNGECTQTLKKHISRVYSVAWSSDSRYLASASADNTIYLWDVSHSKHVKTLQGHTKGIWCIAYSADNLRLATASADGTILLWNVPNGRHLQTLKGHSGWVASVAWSPDGQTLASASEDKTIRIWDTRTGQHLQTLDGHNGWVASVAWSPDGQTLASASGDKTIRIWDIQSGKTLRVLEGHSGSLYCIVFSTNGRWLASKGWDSTIRLWRCDSWACVGMLNESSNSVIIPNVAFHPRLPILATLGERDTIIRIWELDEAVLLGQATQNVNYTTAKLVLVGDSGVGKTGLGWRLAHNEFKEHSSTHGQQFWVIPQLGEKRKDGTECEAVLWDLAGQHVYRPIHSIFLDNVDASLVLFDPSNRQDPLKGAQFWLEQLKGKNQLPPTVLVGARTDRGAPVLSQQELDQFCQRYGITGGFIGTSAKTGEGLEKLLETLKQQIPWEQMTTTVTTVTFKRIKDYVLGLKEKTDRKGVLVSPATLRKQLESIDLTKDKGRKTKEDASVVRPSASVASWQFTDAEMMTAVGHLQNHGYVTILKNSAGEDYILLVPELLASLASSIVLLADKNPRELGAVSESDLLQGKFEFEELKGLEKTEQQILIDSAILRFLEHSICFRETLTNDTVLVFPSLIKQKRPLQDKFEFVDDVSYIVRGRVENLYASLVVSLGYTSSFTRINQWQNQAQYEMNPDQICGFRLNGDREGELEFVLYYSTVMPQYGRTLYQGLFESFLYKREVEVTRIPPVLCPKKHRIERATVIKRVRDGKNFAFCDECGEKTLLPEIEKPERLGAAETDQVQLEEAVAKLRTTYEINLSRVKSFRRDRSAPRCYISYASEQADWACQQLAHDLLDAGIVVLEKSTQVQPSDFILQVCTPEYKQAWDTATSRQKEDAQIIRAQIKNEHVIPLLRKGNNGTATPREFANCRAANFTDDTAFVVSLFDLVLTLYAIPLNHAGFVPLRQELHAQWERTLAGKSEPPRSKTDALKIFISYSHKDEAFKDELVTMLAGLQRRGIVDTWQDRRIEPGDEWNTSIQTAMNECDLALLLVSADYLASRFIQAEEQPKLLQRREEMKLRVIPIIVRPCDWQSEPTIKDIQAMPRDGKEVITFRQDNGERDKAWLTIAQEIEKRAKERK